MKQILNQLASLIKVKTIVTLVVITVFAVLALRGAIAADNVMIIISMVVSFYFGTQHEKISKPYRCRAGACPRRNQRAIEKACHPERATASRRILPLSSMLSTH